MNKPRTIRISLLAASLTLAIPLATFAQGPVQSDEDVAFGTGMVTDGPADVVSPTEAFDGSTRQMRGLQLSGLPLEMSDPRLSGMLSIAANGSGQDFANGFVNIESRTYRIENESGAWTGDGDFVLAVADDEPLMEQETMVLVGEGGHAGLLAYVFVEFGPEGPQFEAVVIENDVAPAPTAMLN